MTKDEMMKDYEEKLAQKDFELQNVLAELNKVKVQDVNKIIQDKATEIAKIKKDYVERIVELEEELKDANKRLESLQEVEKLQKAVNQLQEDNKRIVAYSNLHLNAFRNLMKAMQGTLDNAIDLDTIITDNISKERGKK